ATDGIRTRPQDRYRPAGTARNTVVLDGRHQIAVQHHEHQGPVAPQQVLVEKGDNGLPLPIFNLMIARYQAVVLVKLANFLVGSPMPGKHSPTYVNIIAFKRIAPLKSPVALSKFPCFGRTAHE